MRIGQILLSEKGLSRTDLVSIISHVLSVPRERIFMEPSMDLGEAERRRIEDLAGQRRMGRPLAYLLNRKEFFSESFYVDESVLIPRPETEILVEEALRIVKHKGRPTCVLDMGTGSGAIGLMLAKRGAGCVVCVDISPAALLVARKNATSLGLREEIEFVASDLFSGLAVERRFDLICANLPYVTEHEWKGLMQDVRDFEPRKALVGGATGMELYERYAHEAPAFLASGGTLLCEIGGESQAGALAALFGKGGLNVAIKKDLSGSERVVKASWTSSS